MRWGVQERLFFEEWDGRIILRSIVCLYNNNFLKIKEGLPAKKPGRGALWEGGYLQKEESGVF